MFKKMPLKSATEVMFGDMKDIDLLNFGFEWMLATF